MFSRALFFAAVVFGCAAGSSPRRPKVDLSAMQEAIAATRVQEDFASSASYAHFLRSRLHRQEGETKKAIEELRLALATDAGNPFLLTTLAEEYARSSDLSRAEVELKKVVSLHPRYHPAQLLLGRVLQEGGKLGLAQSALRKAIQLKPRDPDAYLILAQLHLDAGRPEQALKVVEQLGHEVPGEASGYRRLGLALMEKGDLGRAEPLLLRATERDPGDLEVWVALAQLYERTGRPTQAEEAYDRALERDPDNQEVLFQAGQMALKAGSAVRARAYFDRLLSLSQDPELVVKVAFSYLATRQAKEASEVLDAFRTAIPGEPRLAFYAGLVNERLRRFDLAAEAFGAVPADSDLALQARLHQATCLSQAGLHPRALELFRTEVVARPDHLALYPAFARALERAGQDREAESLLRRALQDHPEAELYDALAQALERRGRKAQAIDLIGQALQARPKDEALLYTLGAAYERQGDHDRSIAQMRAVLEVNPDNPDAMNFIGYTLAESARNLDEAERLLLRALELRPGSGPFLDSLGWVYYQRGEVDRAVRTLERAAALAPGESVIAEHLGDAYRRASRPRDAEKAYRRALEVLREAPEGAEHPEAQQKSLEDKLKFLSPEPRSR